jgi:hypothetical protein
MSVINKAFGLLPTLTLELILKPPEPSPIRISILSFFCSPTAKSRLPSKLKSANSKALGS